MSGFNWFLYFLFYNKFSNTLDIPQNIFGFVENQFDEWGGFNYAQQIKNVSLGIGALIGQLPPALIYLMSIGFTLIFVGFIIKLLFEII